MIKEILRVLLPKPVRYFFWKTIPRVHRINTYILRNALLIKDLHRIDDKYVIRQISWDDEVKLKKAFSFRGPRAYSNIIPSRMNSEEWTGIAVVDKTNGDIAYLAWIITNSITYLEEFGIYLKPGQFLLKDGFCVPEYRHQGLHTRMEQERINYSLLHGATDIFIQIHDNNEKGKDSVIKNGYVLINKNYVISWSAFNTYRELISFIKCPFKKVTN